MFQGLVGRECGVGARSGSSMKWAQLMNQPGNAFLLGSWIHVATRTKHLLAHLKEPSSRESNDDIIIGYLSQGFQPLFEERSKDSKKRWGIYLFHVWAYP